MRFILNFADSTSRCRLLFYPIKGRWREQAKSFVTFWVREVIMKREGINTLSIRSYLRALICLAHFNLFCVCFLKSILKDISLWLRNDSRWNVYEVFGNVSFWKRNFVMIHAGMYTKCFFKNIFEKSVRCEKHFLIELEQAIKSLITYSEGRSCYFPSPLG